jgi:ABC-type amino acid transport substrate-binding protein
MSNENSGSGPSMTRGQFLRGGAAIAVAASVSTAAAVPSALAQSATGKGIPGKNGINPGNYIGGDGSYQRYLESGIRLGYMPNPGNLDNPGPDKNSGWNSDILLEALKRVGINKYEYVAGPWETMVPGLQSGRFDMLLSDVHVTPARVDIIDFTTPVYWYGDILVVPKGNPAKIHSWEDMAGKKIGTVRGENYSEMLQKRTDLGGLSLYTDNPTLAADASAGRLDGIMVSDTEFVPLLHENPGLQLEIVSDYVPHSDPIDWTRFGCRKGENDINNVVSHALGEMFIDGTTLQLLKRYDMGTRNLFIVVGS